MAYERLSDSKIVGDNLDAFVEGRLQLYSRQIAIRNADDEMRFNTAVLENNLSLDDQLNYRQEQMKRVGDDPSERRRLMGEISSLKDRIEQKAFSDEFLGKLTDFETGVSSIDSVISYLESRQTVVTDPTIKDTIAKNLSNLKAQRFEIQKEVLNNASAYALKDGSDETLSNQIAKVTSAKNQALLSGNEQLISMYDLQLQALSQAKTENSIAKSIKDMSISTMTGASKATDLLDTYNNKISGASGTTPITVNGVKYDSEQQFWQQKRDAYIADPSANGFFGRFSDEKTTDLKTLYSANSLTNDSVAAASNAFNSLTSRPELQPYIYQINTAKQDVLQTGADLRSNTIVSNYSRNSDVNAAVTNLTALKGLGVNIDQAFTKIITSAADIKSQQLTGIYQRTAELVDQGVDATKAIDQAVREGASLYLSPEQLAAKPAETIAKETNAAQTTGAFKVPDQRTTVASPSTVAPSIPGVVPTTQNQDLSQKYGKVGNAIYRKSDGKAFTNSQEFFADAGVSSFSGLKFDNSYQPPTLNASPTLANSQPTAPTSVPNPTPVKTPTVNAPAQPITYRVAAGDTLSALAQRYLGDAKRYTEIAKANNIADPNKIAAGQQLIIPNK